MADKVALTREDYKKIRFDEKLEASEKEQTAQKPEARTVPIWLRFVIFLLLIFLFFSAGTVIGYNGLGHGSAMDVFKSSTWTHIYDLIEKK